MSFSIGLVGRSRSSVSATLRLTDSHIDTLLVASKLAADEEAIGKINVKTAVYTHC